MGHVSAFELIQLVAGELTAPRREQVQQHLSECAACRALHDDQAALWGRLGSWSEPHTPRDLLAALDGRLRTPQTPARPRVLRIGRVTRVAAAVAFGIGVGYGAARTWPAWPADTSRNAAEAEVAAVAAVGLDLFAEPSPAGLYAALQEPFTSDEAGEGQS